MKKILSIVCLAAFLTVLGCNDAKPTTTAKPAGTTPTPPAGDKKDK